MSDNKVRGCDANPNNRVRANGASMHNGLMSTQDARYHDQCCGIHGAMRERKGAKKATSAARRRLDKEIINAGLEASVAKLLVRISDNVLDDNDWPVRLIEISDGVVVGVEDTHQGAYGMDEMPDKGWDLDRLVKWSSYDGTGTHPENFHEVKAQTDDRYHCVWNRDLLDEVMQRAKREVGQ